MDSREREILDMLCEEKPGTYIIRDNHVFILRMGGDWYDVQCANNMNPVELCSELYYLEGEGIAWAAS